MNADAQSERAAPLVRCPACGAMGDRPRCPECGLWLAGQQATELRWIDSELRRIDEARSWLLGRRATLLADLVQVSADEARQTTSLEPEVAGPVPRGANRERHELSGRTVGRLLLAAGAVLVVIATTVFTVANWSTIGPLGRSAILLALTAVVLIVPVWLKRRALGATAETMAAIGLALTVADVYLTRQLLPTPELSAANQLFVLAAAAAVLAALWGAYGLAARLRTPLLASIVAAQAPGLIATVALVRVSGGDSIAGPIGLALVLTSAADLLVGARILRSARSAASLTASIAATVTWVTAILLAVAALLESQPTAPVVLWMSGVLVAAATVAVAILPNTAVSWLPAGPAAAVSGGLLGTGLALPAIRVAPGWQIAEFAVAGSVVAVVALVLSRVTSAHETGEEGEWPPAVAARLRLVAAGSAAITAAAGLIEIPAAVSGMFPLQRLAAIWSGPAFHRPSFAIGHSGALEPGLVLALASVVCWLAPVPRQSWQRFAALAAITLAVGSIPAAGLTGWAALALLTVAAAAMLGASALNGSAGHSGLTVAAACGGLALALSAAVWSLTWATATVTELAVLTAIFCLVAASTAAAGALATGCAVAAAAGLAGAVTLADGWPAQHAAFAVLAVGVVAAGVATLVRDVRPRHSVVLDAGAGLVAMLAAVMAAQQAGLFAVAAATAALTAGSVAWLRTGLRKSLFLGGAVFAALVAIAADGRSLVSALFRPYAQLATPWRAVAAAPIPGLSLAASVGGICAVAMVMAAGAWRGRRASLDAAALGLALMVTPAVLAGGLRYSLSVGLLLGVALALSAFASASTSLWPAGAALAAAMFAFGWSLAARAPTLIVLGCLCAAYPLCCWRARRTDVRCAAAFLSVLSAAGLAEATALAAGWPAWGAGLAVLGVAALGHAAAGVLESARLRVEGADAAASLEGSSDVSAVTGGIDAAAWFALAIGTAQCLRQPESASAALAISGLICIGVAMRANRRPAFWVGIGLCEAAWVVWLLAAGVSAAEPYTVPAAGAWLAYSRYLARRRPQLTSWWTYGPGLALLLLPSLTEVWNGAGWIRPLSLGLGAAAITLIGARARLQAPLLMGAAATAVDAGHELAPTIRRLAETVPTWVPIAVAGAILLWAGATYEARLRNLGALRKIVGGMR